VRSSFVVAAALAASLAASLAGVAIAQARTGDPAKWSSYWDALMPVFTHPRCINCHGATDPRAGDNHGGGPSVDLADFSCIGCHTANTALVPGRCELPESRGSEFSGPDGTKTDSICVPGEEQGEARVAVGPVWNTTGPEFVGKDARELCRQIKGSMGPALLLEHVTTDPLIGFAFEGKRAIDSQSPFAPMEAEPPPIDRAAFAAVLTRWITEAAMACSIDGTVELVDKLEMDAALAPFGGAAVQKSVAAAIDIKNGVATSTLRYTEKSTSKATALIPGCKVGQSAEVQSTAEGKPETKYQIEMGAGGVYRMQFFLGSVEAHTDFSSKGNLCRPVNRRRGQLPAEPTEELEFGVENQHAERMPGDPGVWILKGSMPVANKMDLSGVTGRSERTVTWDIVIR
jgi:hypothetical protein